MFKNDVINIYPGQITSPFIKNVITKTKRQYAASPYNLDKIDSIQNEVLQVTIDPQLFFEILLLEIRSKTVAFSAALNKKEKDIVKSLENEIINLDKKDPVGNFEKIHTSMYSAQKSYHGLVYQKP